jgi:hemerythrin-like domain-containing protein
MRPTEILSAEHRVIERVLACLEALAGRIRAGAPQDAERAAQMLEFLRTFADRCHHGKEEERLFPMLVNRGMPTHVGPIAVMLDDHRSGRDLVERMARALADADAPAFAEAATGYVALLRDHIAREDGVLFPMAESMLDEAAREALLHSFEAFERDDLGPDTHARMLALAAELAAHFGVAEEDPGGRAPLGSGCRPGCGPP